MKNFLTTLFFLTFSLAVLAQNSASATVETRVTVVEPIRITKSIDLDFGNVIAAINPGSVILAPDGTRIANGVSLSNAVPGEVSPAEAVVTHGELSYSITLPESFTLFNQENPNQVIVINQFTVAPEPSAIAEGTDIIKIGATLNLEANQVPGYYTNTGGFNVTVTYN